MGYNTAFKEVMSEYERDRRQAAQLLAVRQNELFTLLPRVKEIDDTLKYTGIEMSRIMLTHKADAHVQLDALMEKSKALRAEKDKLIVGAGFPADYFTDIYKCNLCHDTGYIHKESAPYEKCICLKQRMINKYYDLSNLGDVLKRENFDYFDLRYYPETVDDRAGLSPYENIKVIYMSCMDFINNFDTEFTNLLFYGDTGLGKTFLMNCIAKELLEMGKTVLYVTAPQIFKVLENYRFNRDEMEEPDDYIDAVTDVDLLMIDDLGTEISTVVTVSELFNIINTRLIEKKHTVISTNLTPNDYENQYSERIVSRFFGNYKMLKFIGEDIRMLKKYRGIKNA